jgi:hypothetical protein
MSDARDVGCTVVVGMPALAVRMLHSQQEAYARPLWLQLRVPCDAAVMRRATAAEEAGGAALELAIGRVGEASCQSFQNPPHLQFRPQRLLPLLYMKVRPPLHQ